MQIENSRHQQTRDLPSLCSDRLCLHWW